MALLRRSRTPPRSAAVPTSSRDVGSGTGDAVDAIGAAVNVVSPTELNEMRLPEAVVKLPPVFTYPDRLPLTGPIAVERSYAAKLADAVPTSEIDVPKRANAGNAVCSVLLI